MKCILYEQLCVACLSMCRYIHTACLPLGCTKMTYLNRTVRNCYFVCFPQLDTPSTHGVFVFTMKWGHAYADLSLFA